MRKVGVLIAMMVWFASIGLANTIDIPLQMSVVRLSPLDNPIGSTPDPTDPNQFRATLTGNTLSIFTQQDNVSYVVIRSDYSERYNEDYFFALSFDNVSCTIDRSGEYGIHIGYWNTDFVAKFYVQEIAIYDFDGKKYAYSSFQSLSPGMYVVRMVTNFGATTTKILKL